MMKFFVTEVNVTAVLAGVTIVGGGAAMIEETYAPIGLLLIVIGLFIAHRELKKTRGH